MKSLNELRDEFVRNYHINCEHEHRELTTEEMNFMFHAWDAALKAQAEQSSSADVHECKFKVFWISANDNGLLDVYRYEPDNHGHQSLKVIDAAALSAMQKENEKLKECLEMWTQLNSKLQKENAILREGLRWISVGTAEPTRFALAVLSDADKVRGAK